MISNNTSTCQDCGGKLKYYDKVRRIVRTKGRVSKCENYHRIKQQDIRSFHFQNGKVDGAKSSYLKSRRPLKKPLIIYAV